MASSMSMSGPGDMDGHRASQQSPDNSHPPASPSSFAQKRACDACHRRKIKCLDSGLRSCKNCMTARLSCTYNAIPQKKGPKGSHAKVISELRATQRQTQLAAQRIGPNSGSDSPGSPNRSSLLSTEMMLACVDFFFVNLYPTQPILHRRKVGETIGMMDTNAEANCLILTLCAYVLIQPNMKLPQTPTDEVPELAQSNMLRGQCVLEEALRVRRSIDHIENPTVWSVITSFFLFGSFFGLNKHNTAWFHLREATTLAHLIGMHDESSYNMPDVPESSRRRRLYWLLFVTERAYALQQHKPLTLYPTINLPKIDEDPTETVELSGFLHLVNLFRPFDDTFVGLWNKARTGCTTEWLAQLQKQLSDSLPSYLHSTETQAVDLRCSQQWLRTMVWQLSISQGFLSSATADGAMSLTFPIEISRDLVAATPQFSQQVMEVHGIGFIEKLFDIACTLTDVMACVPQKQPYTSFEIGPRDYLDQLVTLISSLRGGRQRYLPLLMTKITDTLPSAATRYTMPLTASPPDAATAAMIEDETWRQGAKSSAGSSPAPALIEHNPQPVGMAGVAHYPQPFPPSVLPPQQQQGMMQYIGSEPHSTVSMDAMAAMTRMAFEQTGLPVGMDMGIGRGRGRGGFGGSNG